MELYDYRTAPTPSESAEQDQVLAMAKDAAETGVWVFVQNYADPNEVCWDCARKATRQLHVFVPPPDRTEVVMPSCPRHWVATVNAFGRPPFGYTGESFMWPLDVPEAAALDRARGELAAILPPLVEATGIPARELVRQSVVRWFSAHRPDG